MNTAPVAASILRDLQAVHARATLRNGRLVIAPASVVPADLQSRVRVTACDVIALLREREGAASTSAVPRPAAVPACELRRFPDWRPAQVVRFCCESDHRHEDGIATYDAQEVEHLLRWARTAGVSRLPAALRNALLDLKSTIGGRVVPGLDLTETMTRPTRS